MEALVKQLDNTVSFRPRTYPIVAEYLPIHLQIDKEDFSRRVEIDNYLPEHSISSIRWIKPPHCRSDTQRKAFALLQVNDVKVANEILKEGICIESERIEVKKDRKEPVRCVKCQKFGHIACSCLSLNDTCGTCRDQHGTTACNAFRTTRCISCNSNQHASWSRACPEFKRRCLLRH